MELIIIAFATFLNFGLLKWKFDHGRYADATLDLAILVALSFLFGGTMGGMIIAMISGALMSLYLLVSPPKFLSF